MWYTRADIVPLSAAGGACSTQILSKARGKRKQVEFCRFRTSCHGEVRASGQDVGPSGAQEKQKQLPEAECIVPSDRTASKLLSRSRRNYSRPTFEHPPHDNCSFIFWSSSTEAPAPRNAKQKRHCTIDPASFFFQEQLCCSRYSKNIPQEICAKAASRPLAFAVGSRKSQRNLSPCVRRTSCPSAPESPVAIFGAELEAGQAAA